ncbi:MAG: methanol--corrinoid methyltransferase [Nitrososphaeria archaeon]|nr:methanol--corrinoid methyltransferase [Nitrososphaeria archaeon]
MRFTELAYDTPKDLLFGFAKHPLNYGFDLSVGRGKVIPEVKYLLKPGFEKEKDLLLEEYKKTTMAIMERIVNLGFKEVQLDTEFVEPMVRNVEWGSSVVREQKEILHKYYLEHGVKSALRATVADIRRFERGLRKDDYVQMILESFEYSVDEGADLLSIESRGGQEVFSYSIMRNDLSGILFSIAILASRDVRFLWREIVSLSKDAIPAGDTACALANSAMVLADGLINRRIPHVLSTVVRAMSAVRTLACYEEGARGPGKDCAYENVIIKAITGYPVSMEGKTSAPAHSSLVGNISAAACDLWSNESITVDDFFSGKSVAAMLEILCYDVSIMNTSITLNLNRELQRVLIESDKYRDPQALILSPDNALRIAGAIVSEKTDYNRAVAAANEAVKIIEENLDKLKCPEAEIRYLSLIKKFFENIPEEERFIDEAVKKYSEKVQSFKPSNYEL